MQITPAILPHSFEELIEKLSQVDGVSSHIQIDLCDGVFGREKTWMPDGIEKLPTSFTYEFDVMVDDWKSVVPKCVSLGAKAIIVHTDMFGDSDMEKLVKMVSPNAISLGISVSNDKSIDFHEDMIRQAKNLYSNVFIQVMGIKQIGEQGQLFDEDCLGRVTSLKQNFGDVLLQVDGGIVPETAKKVKEVGADTVVVGSFIFGSNDPAGAVGIMSVDTETYRTE